MNPWEMAWRSKASPLDTALQAEGVTGQLAELARSVYKQESDSGANTKTSNANAVGDMQIKPETFASVADKDWNIKDPVQNARGGIRYLKQMYEQAGGDLKLAAAGYYGGPNGLEKARKGVAVSDPRNPKAPNTLQYGKQVADRALSAISGTAHAETAPQGKMPWEMDWKIQNQQKPDQQTAQPEQEPGWGTRLENRVRGFFGAPKVGENPEFDKVANADSPFPDMLPVAPNTLNQLASAASSPFRYMLRGGEAGMSKVKDALSTFEKAGTTPSGGQALQTRFGRGVESALSKVPGSAGVMASAAERQAAELGTQAEKIADKLASGASPFTAGSTIEKGLAGKGGFVERFKAGQKALFGKLDAFIPANKAVKVDGTRKALASMTEDIEGAEALSKFFQNSKIKAIKEAMEKDVAMPGGVMVAPPNASTAEARAAASHGLLKKGAAEVREGQAPIGGTTPPKRNPYTGRESPGVRTAGRAPNVIIDPNNAAIPSYAIGKTIPIPGGSPTNELPYEAVKKLRTLVGQELENGSLVADVPRSKWKALYAALSEDLNQAAVATGNPEAVKAMKRANAFSRAGYDRIESVLDKVSGQNIPENIYRAATAATDMEAGASKINAVMKSLQPTERDVVRSAFIRRMGLAKAGAQGAEGDIFSSQTFLTNWNKMSPQAKRVMFASEDGNLRESMDAIAKVADNIKQGSKVFANPSGTAPAAAQIGLMAGVGTAAATGQVGTAAAMLGGAAGANLSARLLTSPKFARWLSRSMNLDPLTARQAVISLGNAMRDEPEDVQQEAQQYAASVDAALPK